MKPHTLSLLALLAMTCGAVEPFDALVWNRCRVL
jgi:hypothetical protein